MWFAVWNFLSIKISASCLSLFQTCRCGMLSYVVQPSGTNKAWSSFSVNVSTLSPFFVLSGWFPVPKFPIPCYNYFWDTNTLQSTAWGVAKDDHLIPNSYMCRYPFSAQTSGTMSPDTYHVYLALCLDKSFRMDSSQCWYLFLFAPKKQMEGDGCYGI